MDTLLPTKMFPHLPLGTTFIADTNFVSGCCSETFCVCNKCLPVCAAQETSWATMCPRLPGPLKFEYKPSGTSPGYCLPLLSSMKQLGVF